MVLCRFLAISLANTAFSGAIIVFHMDENPKMSNSTAHAQAVWWDFGKKTTIAEGLPPYDDSTDATAATTPQSLGLEGAAVGRARAAADGSAGGGFGATWRWG